MQKTTRRWLLWGVAVAVLLGSLWLNAQAGLALVIDPVTGVKGCINMLSAYVGLDDTDWRFVAIKVYSLLWLPMSLAFIVVTVFKLAMYLRGQA